MAAPHLTTFLAFRTISSTKPLFFFQLITKVPLTFSRNQVNKSKAENGRALKQIHRQIEAKASEVSEKEKVLNLLTKLVRDYPDMFKLEKLETNRQQLQTQLLELREELDTQLAQQKKLETMQRGINEQLQTVEKQARAVKDL